MEMERGLSISTVPSTVATDHGSEFSEFLPKCINEVPNLEDQMKAGNSKASFEGGNPKFKIDNYHPFC